MHELTLLAVCNTSERPCPQSLTFETIFYQFNQGYHHINTTLQVNSAVLSINNPLFIYNFTYISAKAHATGKIVNKQRIV